MFVAAYPTGSNRPPAAERSVHTFTASYLAENRPVAALVEDAGARGTQVIEAGDRGLLTRA